MPAAENTAASLHIRHVLLDTPDLENALTENQAFTECHNNFWELRLLGPCLGGYWSIVLNQSIGYQMQIHPQKEASNLAVVVVAYTDHMSLLGSIVPLHAQDLMVLSKLVSSLFYA
jgi:hypothetical protein